MINGSCSKWNIFQKKIMVLTQRNFHFERLQNPWVWNRFHLRGYTTSVLYYNDFRAWRKPKKINWGKGHQCKCSVSGYHILNRSFRSHHFKAIFGPKVNFLDGPKNGPGPMDRTKINLMNLDPEWHSKCQKYDFSNIWFFVYLLCLNFFRCQNLFFTSFEIFPFSWLYQCPPYISPQIVNIDSIRGPNPVL